MRSRVPAAPVDGLYLPERLPRALDGKEVEHRRGHEHRPRVREQEHAGVIDTGGDGAREVLLGIAVGILEDAVVHPHREGADVAGRRDHADPGVERADERGLEPAAAGAGDADPPGVDLRARQQVVEGAHPVPDLPAREVRAGEIREIADDRVLSAHQVVAAASGRRHPRTGCAPPAPPDPSR